ncbi:tellurite resistance TerB family protein [Hoeflea prorocentri]|uniref:Tellurite resistance TerB family protein n=1 Tax=Hoeflea prorocentri TaxID=1922333 RepID=A0A9X3UNX9_9HYPH|nr:tellurite resistance TerB family protein [Hoeflea prorocentri]MCY6382521.1 tellurite resistance TerB family protein [Hoeflea prorocentri]MDA5400321.1 tellurite resistance TerB family protein [Hoeflea prorocentri]
MSSPITIQDALIYVMVTMSAVDRTMTDAELAQIGNVTRTLPIFQDFNEERLVRVSKDCGAILSEQDGLDTVLLIIHDALPANLYDTAYSLAVEIAAADLHVEQEELRFLQILRDRLALDKLTCAAIERGAMARYRTH